MGQIERGERSVPLDNVLKIVDTLDVSLDYLLQDSLTLKDSNTRII